jgi:hypothetical protein
MSNEFKSDETLNKSNEINDFFKMPIYYNANKVELNKNIVSDLELVSTIDQSCNPIYEYCFNNDNDVSKKLIEQVSKYYTTDTLFLKDNQKLLKDYKKLENKYTDFSPNYKNIIEIWNELKNESGFKEKYYYVDWEMFEFLNKSDLFLQVMSIYNLFSPILTLLIPIIILIIPFIIIKMKGLNVSLSEYFDVLKIVAQQNAIGKLFTVNFSEIHLQERIYIIISAAFYLFSIYQNIMVCIRFHKNMTIIHNHFKEIKIYLNKTLTTMENYLSYSNKLVSHNDFNNNLTLKMQLLTHINKKLCSLSEYSLNNVSKFKEIGHILKYFYELHTDKEYEDAIMYSFGFNGYIDCIEGLQNNIKEKKINFAIFIKENKKTVFKKSYYASLSNNEINCKPIKNTIKLKKNMIITGPNASGKTTILKSTLINIIFTQQFGCGFYDSAKLAPYNHIHCYLNIPDTSGRDSLFQAEARRCKEILDVVSAYKKESHFCVFDELYSGTNPEEAEICATAFMSYLTNYNNVSCLLTTHFINVCKNLKNEKNIMNFHMSSEKINHKLKYHYILKQGITEVKGGINILTEMNYPEEIINKTINY